MMSIYFRPTNRFSGLKTAAELNVIWHGEAMDIIDEFFKAVDEIGFKFWVCPNRCNDIVYWIGDRAICGKCGKDNQEIQRIKDR